MTTFKGDENTLNAKLRRALADKGAFVVKLAGGQYQRPGIPDFLVIYKGTTTLIECKSADGQLSGAQVAVLKEIQRAGGRTIVLRYGDLNWELCLSAPVCSIVPIEAKIVGASFEERVEHLMPFL